MKRRIPFLLILGTCLIVFSLCCVIVVQLRQYDGAKNCQEVAMEMNKLLPTEHLAFREYIQILLCPFWKSMGQTMWRCLRFLLKVSYCLWPINGTVWDFPILQPVFPEVRMIKAWLLVE